MFVKNAIWYTYLEQIMPVECPDGLGNLWYHLILKYNKEKRSGWSLSKLSNYFAIRQLFSALAWEVCNLHPLYLGLPIYIVYNKRLCLKPSNQTRAGRKYLANELLEQVQYVASSNQRFHIQGAIRMIIIKNRWMSFTTSQIGKPPFLLKISIWINFNNS